MPHPFPLLSPFARAVAALLFAASAVAPVPAQVPGPPTPPPAASEQGAPPYPDLADLVLASPMIADATVRSAVRIKGAEAAGVPAGRARFYVRADIAALVRAPGGVAPRIGYVLDAPLDARGRPPKLKKRRVLLFARPIAGSADQVQLAAPDAQIDWTIPADARVRRIARELAAPGAAPAIAGVGSAFHVPGALPGEGETQVFLQTEGGAPVSLSVLRRPGEEPRWAVALSEIVDEAAGPPAPDTLLHYRLACSLPRSLPDGATRELADADAARARDDYALVLDRLGPCTRARPAS